MLMGKKLISAIIFIICLAQLFAQQDNYALDLNEELKRNKIIQPETDRVKLASAIKEYPVTPGDVYRLNYLAGRGFESLESVVQSDFSLNLRIFGTLQVEGLSYQELRKKVEELVRHAYPESKPQLVIQSTGIFQVYLKGEVKTAQYIDCWGLSQLSMVVEGKTTDYSSFRDIQIVKNDGSVKKYDLFKAQRFGEKGEDPYAKPGDTIIISKAVRQVKVIGEVFRPDTYQLIGGEGLNDLILTHAGGFTKLSELTRIRVVRHISETSTSGEVYYLDSSTSLFKEFILHDLDEVYILNKKDSLPVVYFEGAIEFEGVKKEGSVPKSSYRYTYPLVEGQKLSGAIHELYTILSSEADFSKTNLSEADLKESEKTKESPLNSIFSSEADLKNAYIIRSGEKLPITVDIEALIHDYTEEKDILLKPYDLIVIPLKQYYVTVSGAVFKPGIYPYVPNRSYKYYLYIAGGSDPQKNVNESVIITDANDVKQPITRIIRPDDKIYAEYNNQLYHLNQWGTFLGTAISVAALIISIINLNK